MGSTCGVAESHGEEKLGSDDRVSVALPLSASIR